MERGIACSICLATFEGIEDLISHLRIHQAQEAQATSSHQYIPNGNFENNDAFSDTTEDDSPSQSSGKNQSSSGSSFISRHIRIEYDQTISTGEPADSFAISCEEEHPDQRIGRKKKPYKCKFCLKMFRRLENVRVHQRIHTGEKPFQCTICHKYFAQRQHITGHIKRAHLDERNYPCSSCDKKFRCRQDLDRHEMIHSGVKPYGCEFCDKKFIQQHAAKRHEQTHINPKKKGAPTLYARNLKAGIIDEDGEPRR